MPDGFTDIKIGFKEEADNINICISGSSDLTPEVAMKAISYVLAYIDENSPGKLEQVIEKFKLDNSGTVNFYDMALFKKGILYNGSQSNTTANAES